MHTILAQNELKNTKGTHSVSCSAYYFVISILFPCHVCFIASLSGSSFSFMCHGRSVVVVGAEPGRIFLEFYYLESHDTQNKYLY